MFSTGELERFLPQSSLTLLHKIIQEREIELAGIEGLESCPFCSYSVCIDNPDERLFTCLNESCLRVSCRQCGKEDHLPKTCKGQSFFSIIECPTERLFVVIPTLEMEADHKLDHRHAVEEAMSEASIRKCPKCQQTFVKEDGCNKMTCSACRTLSCYICRAVITGTFSALVPLPPPFRI